MDKSRIEPTIFLIEKISFSLKLFSGHFYGQIFIKTVRGPWLRSKCILLFSTVTTEIVSPEICFAISFRARLRWGRVQLE